MQGFSMSLFPLTFHLECFNHVVATATGMQHLPFVMTPKISFLKHQIQTEDQGALAESLGLQYKIGTAETSSLMN